MLTRHVRVWCCAVLLAMVAADAEASLQGIIGFSGKQSDTCSICHDDGVTPLVEFDGPARFAADTLAQFRFVVESRGANQQLAGFNVAASDGVLGIDPEQNGRVQLNELAHTAPQSNDENGQASWTFEWCVPTGGNVRLFGAGNSVNGNGTRSGDAAAATVVEVRVTPPTGDVNCDGRRTAADITAVYTSVNAGVCESPDDGSAEGMTELDATIGLLFVPACQF